MVSVFLLASWDTAGRPIGLVGSTRTHMCSITLFSRSVRVIPTLDGRYYTSPRVGPSELFDSFNLFPVEAGLRCVEKLKSHPAAAVLVVVLSFYILDSMEILEIKFQNGLRLLTFLSTLYVVTTRTYSEGSVRSPSPV